MVWALGALLVVAGILLLIYAIQGKWPLASITMPGAPVDEKPPHDGGGKPIEPVSR